MYPWEKRLESAVVRSELRQGAPGGRAHAGIGERIDRKLLKGGSGVPVADRRQKIYDGELHERTLLAGQGHPDRRSNDVAVRVRVQRLDGVQPAIDARIQNERRDEVVYRIFAWMR